MNQNDKQLLEMAKEKLRWYTMEASEEEFDAETVDALVNLVRTLEEERQPREQQGINPWITEQKTTESEDNESVLKQFREYCDLRLEDEAAASNVTLKKSRKKILIFPGRSQVAVITAACVLVLVAVFGSLGIVNAGEDQGFFHWLRRDERGTKVVTVPTEVGLGDGRVIIYESVDDVPERIRSYLPEAGDFLSLQEFALQNIQSWNWELSQRVGIRFARTDNKEIFVEMGVIIFKDELSVTWEQYDEYEFRGSEMIGEYKQDIFVHEEKTGKTEYLLVFYEGNKQYFVSGTCSLEKLKQVSEEYVMYIGR